MAIPGWNYTVSEAAERLQRIESSVNCITKAAILPQVLTSLPHSPLQQLILLPRAEIRQSILRGASVLKIFRFDELIPPPSSRGHVGHVVLLCTVINKVGSDSWPNFDSRYLISCPAKTSAELFPLHQSSKASPAGGSVTTINQLESKFDRSIHFKIMVRQTLSPPLLPLAPS